MQLDDCLFPDGLNSPDVHFHSGVSFIGSVFNGDVSLAHCSAYELVDFSCAHVAGFLDISNARSLRGGLKMDGLRCGTLKLEGAQIDSDLLLTDVVSDGLILVGTKIAGVAQFNVCRFDGAMAATQPTFVRLDRAEFAQGARFYDVHFPSDTTFGSPDGGGRVNLGPWLSPASFGDDKTLSIISCRFGSPVHGGRHLLSNLDLTDLTFRNNEVYGIMSFKGTKVSGRATIVGIRMVQMDPDYSGERVGHESVFDLEEFRAGSALTLGPVSAEGDGGIKIGLASTCDDVQMVGLAADGYVEFTRTTFSSYAAISTGVVGCLTFSECQFVRGGLITTGALKIRLSDFDSRQPLTITAAEGLEKPSLGALTRANVENLIIRDVSLESTAFAGAINLEKLRIDGRPHFLERKGWTKAKRQMLFDEVEYRRNISNDADSRGWLDVDRKAADIAATYRSFRKSREDGKDEPGGADFYYGEMEMRRLSSAPASVERALLTAYWAIAGYGLRAWRAFVALLVVITVLGVLWAHSRSDILMGCHTASSILELLRISIALERVPSVPAGTSLSIAQSGILISARLLIPALLALAVLAIRGRLKR